MEGLTCPALEDTGSKVTLVRPVSVPVRLSSAEKGITTLTVRGRTLYHPVWVVAVQDTCILGLDLGAQASS